MNFRELEEIVQTAKAPRTRFHIHQDNYSRSVILSCHVTTRDIHTRKRNQISMQQMIAIPTARNPYFNKAFWCDRMRDLLRMLMEHEIDEHLEIDGDRPFYPHGKWKRLKI